MVFWDSFSCPLGESDDDDPKALDQMALRLRFRLQTLAAAAGCDRELHPTQAAPSHTPTLRPRCASARLHIACVRGGGRVARGRRQAGRIRRVHDARPMRKCGGGERCAALRSPLRDVRLPLSPAATTPPPLQTRHRSHLHPSRIRYDAWYERGASAPATLLVTSSPELAAAAHHMALRGLDVTLAAPPPAAAGEPAARRAPGVSGSGVETPVVGGMRAAYSWPKLYRTVGAEEKGAAEEAARRTLGARGRHEISQLFSQTAVAKVVSRSRSIDPTTLRLESSAAEARADAAAMVRVAQREVEEAARRAATAEARAASAEAIAQGPKRC